MILLACTTQIQNMDPFIVSSLSVACLSSTMIAIATTALSVEALGTCLVGRLIFPTDEQKYLAGE